MVDVDVTVVYLDARLENDMSMGLIIVIWSPVLGRVHETETGPVLVPVEAAAVRLVPVRAHLKSIRKSLADATENAVNLGTRFRCGLPVTGPEML